MSAPPYVIDDRDNARFKVHRSVFVDDEVLRLERARIFDKVWLFAGHESEVRQPHDFVTRNVGGHAVIMTRNKDGQVRVFLNVCPHRGMQIEARPTGHGRFLKCFYHGWSSAPTERLSLGLAKTPTGRVSTATTCVSSARHVWTPIAASSSLSWNADVEPLETYLAGAADALDLFADQSEEGMEITSGTHLYAIRGNWKMLSENSYDTYHTLTLHHRYFAMLKDSGKDLKEVFSHAGGPSLSWDFGRGHAMVGGTDGSGGHNTFIGFELTGKAKEAHLERRRRFGELYGDDWANRMFATRNLVLFPNTAVIDMSVGATIRTYYPLSPDYMEVTAWTLQPAVEEPELRRVRQANGIVVLGARRPRDTR